MYYRRKVLFGLFEAFGGELEKIRLQKLLMLLSKEQSKPSYDFVPYKYGCYSFQANADLKTLSKYGQVLDVQKTWKKLDNDNYFDILKADEKNAIKRIFNKYEGLSTNDLIELTYYKYPYYALNSTIAHRVLNDEYLNKIQSMKDGVSGEKLFTIGYEGITLEAYLNKLIKYGVKALIDVRRNPKSMKYGFSKNQLQNACEGVNINYYHFPDVGIDSAKRQDLNSQKDYDLLFEDYKKNTIPKSFNSQDDIIGLIEKYKRVALTCFEANICQCHRKPLAEAIKANPRFKWSLNHI